MDLVDEQHVARLEIGQDGGHVAASHQCRPRGDPKAGPHLARYNPSQSGLSEARGTCEQHMVHRLLATPGRFEDYLELVPQELLADEVKKPLRAYPDLEGAVAVEWCRLFPAH